MLIRGLHALGSSGMLMVQRGVCKLRSSLFLHPNHPLADSRLLISTVTVPLLQLLLLLLPPLCRSVSHQDLSFEILPGRPCSLDWSGKNVASRDGRPISSMPCSLAALQGT
jgi:hypothetical protein